MNTIGWLGSIMLALCGAPQAYQCWKLGHARGLNVPFLILWTLGEIFTLVAITVNAPVLYLFFNYGMNLIFLAIIWKYKLKPRKQ